MIVAFALPHRSTLSGLHDAAKSALARGAEALVLAEHPLGPWASAPQAAAFLSSTTTVPIGVALNGRARHSLHLAADISLLQRIMCRPPLCIVHGLGSKDLSPLREALDKVAPPLIPFGTPIWIASEGPNGPGEPLELLPLGTSSIVDDAAPGIWMHAQDVPECWDRVGNSPLIVIFVESPGSVELSSSDLIRLKYPQEDQAAWLRIGLEYEDL